MKPFTSVPAGDGSSQDLLAHYEAVAQASADMLLAARRGDWALVVDLEQACLALIARLNQAAQLQPLKPAQRKERIRILQRILFNDAQIRHLAHPGHARVDALLAGRVITSH